MITTILITLLAVFGLSYLVRFYTRYRRMKTITDRMVQLGPHHPIWGHLLLFQDMAEFCSRASEVVEKTRAKVICSWIMFIVPLISTCHPDTAKVVIKEATAKPKHEIVGYRLVEPWLGDGLLLSDGKKWERNRRLLTPAFHFDILRPYVDIYNEVAEIFLGKLQKFCDAKESVEIYSLVTLAALDTMLRCSLSYEGHVQEEGSDHPYAEAVRNLARLTVSRSLKPWLYFDFIYKFSTEGKEFYKLIDFVHQFADDIIQSRRKTLADDPGQLQKRRRDFLDILITAKDDQGEGLSDLDIRAEVDTFLFEGHDTTSSSMSWAIYSLAKHPEEQETLYKEVMEVLNGRDKLQWEDLPSLKYMSMFLKEVMRMHTPVPFIGRVADKPLTLDGITIPAKTKIDILLHTINHHPDLWSDPQEFRPRRFDEETKQDRDPYSYIPFSAGSRNCIGQNFVVSEEKVMLASLIKRFKVSLVEGHIYEHYPQFVMTAKYGIKINLEERKNR
ncbi:leukotriene-B4 omega-hydroxylase 3-like [Saccostrea cucullata]|uniref:leukotriene-B4 omega-hydroxylase 3-like n=1 Tax=Saccostrea cuccullata TaxID=36930 RepID=UPI002ED1B73B